MVGTEKSPKNDTAPIAAPVQSTVPKDTKDEYIKNLLTEFRL